jgi:PAS domain S-box-containing protein
MAYPGFPSNGSDPDLSEYTLETLHSNEEFVLCRGCRRTGASPHPPSVLVLMVRSEHPRPQSVRMLEHEHSLRAELDRTWAVPPVELMQYEGRTVLLLKDPGGEPLDQLAGTPMEMGQFLRVAIGLSAAVRQLHGRGLIHKDLKPANVMIEPSTGQVWLMGFGIASRLPRERQSAEPPEFIAGTFAYMAPEQTGRMNRSIDSRSDLYALGVTLYEMLTGTLPFTASDPMEWVHCHIAKQPPAPGERRKDVPHSVSGIITKLLAKTAEERYQTAAGLESDLRRCLAEWDCEHCIGEFPLGADDRPDRLLIPEKLYGREREVETLLASFDRVVKSGTPELVLVSGYSGIGKSSVVNELHKVLVPPRGLFASGKFDQYKRDIPYATLAQAFQSLIRPLLSKSEADLNSWREALGEALGPNGLLIVDLVPELKLIIGEQPPIPELPPQQAQSRFQLVFRRFIRVFARPKHPLALFLDDLQWLDAATLDLLEDLLTQSDLQHLMLIGAYRDNEVDATHPLARKLEAVKNGGAKIEEITLAPLASEHLGRLIADAFRCEPERAAPLAQLVHGKTSGNPFFALQFMSALAEEGLLSFDHDAARWSWDLNRIHAKGYTDNVVDLMAGRLTRLPVETQKVLQQLACLGNVAEIAMLCMVRGTGPGAVHADLWEAVRQELIVRLPGSYTFVHDRVQEAAYSLIPEELRAAAHLRIGRLLGARTPAEKREETIFEIVNQLNRGALLMTSRQERSQLAELNLIAGRRAKNSAAYRSALNYFSTGIGLLGDGLWESQQGPAYRLSFEQADCEFLSRNFDEALRLFHALLAHARTTLEQAEIHRVVVDIHTAKIEIEEAIACGLGALRLLGIDIPRHPSPEEVAREYDAIWKNLNGRAIEDLIDLPLMTDPEVEAALGILVILFVPAMAVDRNLVLLCSCHMLNMTIRHGNCDASVMAYGCLGMNLGPYSGDYRRGFQFGRLGYDLVAKRQLVAYKAQIEYIIGTFLSFWNEPRTLAIEHLYSAFKATVAAGDLNIASYVCDHLVSHKLAAGEPLDKLYVESEAFLDFTRKAKFDPSCQIITRTQRFIQAMRGFTADVSTWSSADFDEDEYERRMERYEWTSIVCGYHIMKLQTRVISGDYHAAIMARARATPLLWANTGMVQEAEYHFYGALALAAYYNEASADERSDLLAALKAHHQQLELWAQTCPENFENRSTLVAAERARIEGRDVDAMRLYQQAVRSACTNTFVHYEALANEVAARFYRGHGLEEVAHLYVGNARRCYLRWGADGKVRQLDESYPHLREEQPVAGPRSTIGTPIERLELATVLKISQTLSSEIVLEKLINALLRTAIEHAGAERGLLIMPRRADLRIQAEAITGGSSVTIDLCDAPISSAELPEPVIQYAARTQESVILDDASARGSFSNDEYIRREHARSILCLPLVKQGRLIALLYLENNLAANVFTPARIAVLNVLASAAAISLENSRLYHELQEREAKIRRLVDANIVGVLIANLEGQILEANDAFLQMVWYTREDVTSGRLHWTELTPPEWHAATERAVEQLRASGTCEIYEKEYFRSDGSRVPVLITATVVGDSQSETLVFVLDLTERNRLRQAQADLAYMNRVITVGELAASLAHEIKQPIAAAVMDARVCARWLQRDTPNIAEACEAASRMVKDTMRAADIIDRVRSLYRRGTPQRERVDLNEIVREMIVLLHDEANRYSIPIRTELTPALPEVMADRVQIQQVLMNLMLNGIEAMKDTSGELTVTSKLTEDGQLIISVSDSGIGLPQEQPDRIFETFFTTKSQGTGMGLSISRAIVESHGGRLWATANPGRGATFQFTLGNEMTASSASAV